jgi:OOP family OmpA-OmpF porin
MSWAFIGPFGLRYKIDSTRVVTAWYGKLNPVANNQTEEGRALNRRIEIAVGGK